MRRVSLVPGVLVLAASVIALSSATRGESTPAITSPWSDCHTEVTPGIVSDWQLAFFPIGEKEPPHETVPSGRNARGLA